MPPRCTSRPLWWLPLFCVFAPLGLLLLTATPKFGHALAAPDSCIFIIDDNRPRKHPMRLSVGNRIEVTLKRSNPVKYTGNVAHMSRTHIRFLDSTEIKLDSIQHIRFPDFRKPGKVMGAVMIETGFLVGLLATHYISSDDGLGVGFDAVGYTAGTLLIGSPGMLFGGLLLRRSIRLGKRVMTIGNGHHFEFHEREWRPQIEASIHE